MRLTSSFLRDYRAAGRAPVQLERVLAVGRAFLTVTGLIAIFLDPTEPTRLRGITYGVLLAYALYSVAVLAYVQRSVRLTPRHGLALHGLDILWTSALTFVSEGPVSPFFLFFLFVVLAAAYRGGFRESDWNSEPGYESTRGDFRRREPGYGGESIYTRASGPLNDRDFGPDRARSSARGRFGERAEYDNDEPRYGVQSPRSEREGNGRSNYEDGRAYLRERFGIEWCLSPEHSLFLHAGNHSVPRQLLVRSPKGGTSQRPFVPVRRCSTFARPYPLPRTSLSRRDCGCSRYPPH